MAIANLNTASITRDSCVRAFTERFGTAPLWISAAPGRVNIIGEHTDYNGGFVLPMAIDRRTWIAAAPNTTHAWRVFSASLQEEHAIDLATAVQPVRNSWANYVRGVVRGFQDLGARVPGMDVFIDSNVPPGGGLSSSAALEVATATLLQAACNVELEPLKAVLLCQKAEHEFAGVPCGIMDQMVSAFAREGHLLLIDCRSLELEFVPFTDRQVSILIVNTNVRHELTGGEYAARRSSCSQAAATLGVNLLRDATLDQLNAFQSKLDVVTAKRARHVITENARTLNTRDAITNRDWAAAGRLMYESHASLRDDFEVSCTELDSVVEIAASIGEAGGVWGCRMTGGGFGGCAVALIRTDARDEIIQRVHTEYTRAAAKAPSLYVTFPSGGAALVTRPGS